MNIVNARVDDRLVHGCVATLWTPKLQIQRIVCIDDENAENPVLKSALRMATPRNVYLSVLKLDVAIANLQMDKYQLERILIVAKSPKTFLALVEHGIKINQVVMGNLGNLNRSADSVVISKYITLNNEELGYISKLNTLGIDMVAQLSPDDTLIQNFYQEIERKMKG